MLHLTDSSRINVSGRMLIVYGIGLFLVLLLAACGSSGSANTGSGSATTTSATQSSNTGNAANTGADYGGNGYGGKYGNSNTSTTATANSAGTGTSQAVQIVNMSSGFGFSPASLTVPVGTTVVWTNTTSAPHTVTSNDGKTFDSGISQPMQTGQTFSFKFTKAGTYTYHCQIHTSMVGTIIVH